MRQPTRSASRTGRKRSDHFAAGHPSCDPATREYVIAFFKDTSLVLIIGIFDLLTTAKTAIIDPAWQSFSVEV